MLMRVTLALSVGLAAFGYSDEVHANQPIGVFTGIYGTVSVTQAGTQDPLPVSVRDPVHFLDRIATAADSRMRALLDDDTLLSLAEDSQLEITEHIYDPEAGQRIAILKLVRGAVRALVSKMPGAGSKFEIHTDTGIAAARGTYFVVWLEDDGRMGVANIGDQGDVAFIANGLETMVKPGQYFLSVPRPTLASAASVSDPPALNRAIESTKVRDNIAKEMPRKTMDAAGGVLVPDLPKLPHSLRSFVLNPTSKGSSKDSNGSLGSNVTSIGGASAAPNAMPGLVGQGLGLGPNPAGLTKGLKHFNTKEGK
jgi:hypothetical protein